MMINKVTLYDLRLPLLVPYGNSLGALTEFTSIVAVLTDENGNEELKFSKVCIC